MEAEGASIEPPPSAQPSQLCPPGSWTLVALVQARLVAPETKKPGFLGTARKPTVWALLLPRKQVAGHTHNAGMSHNVGASDTT